MHRLLLLGALVGVATMLLLPPTSAARSDAVRPSLEVVSLQPLRVVGERFRAGERVRLSASIDGRRAVVWRRAGVRGRFVVSFASTGVDRVCSLRLTALGRGGSRADLALDHLVCPSTS